MLYLRLVFPSIQRNDSPLSILPQWLSVLGKKVDAASVTQDPCGLVLWGTWCYQLESIWYITSVGTAELYTSQSVSK